VISKWQKKYPLALTGDTRVATDNWPYIYLEHAQIPSLYFFLAGLLLLLFARGCARLKATMSIIAWSTHHWHFFFLGAAFMLLEVHGISKACVVLGSTWWVNAAVISGVLSMILLANAIALRFPQASGNKVYYALFASCAILYTADLTVVSTVSYATRVSLVAAMTTLPLLFSGILFAHSFSVTDRKDLALGANMLGALVGALLQTFSFVAGLNSLVLVVVGLYAGAMLTAAGKVLAARETGAAVCAGEEAALLQGYTPGRSYTSAEGTTA